MAKTIRNAARITNILTKYFTKNVHCRNFGTTSSNVKISKITKNMKFKLFHIYIKITTPSNQNYFIL